MGGELTQENRQWNKRNRPGYKQSYLCVLLFSIMCAKGHKIFKNTKNIHYLMSILSFKTSIFQAIHFQVKRSGRLERDISKMLTVH